MNEVGIDDQINLEIDALFNRLDDNKDGVMSEEELYKAMSASSHGKQSRQDVKEIMKALDTDGNGYIDREEFREFMVNQMKQDIISAEDEMEDLRTRFKEYDLDGSGWLSPAEI